MPKNIMKVDIFQPHEIKETDSEIMKKHYHGRTNSTPTKYSFHFDTKLYGGSFYIEWEQIPQFIMDKTVQYRSKLNTKKLFAPSAPELKRKINELFEAYMREYSEINYTKKIAIKLSNYLSDGLSIGINYKVFYTKTYYNENGKVIKEINKRNMSDTGGEFHTDGYDVYNYSKELEDSIVGLQKKMYNGMKEFISKMGSDKEIISHFQTYNLLEAK